MTTIGTPFSTTAVRVLLLGSGELGKELCIELQRLGVEVSAVDSYANAPAMQVAQHSFVIDMTDAAQLRALIQRQQPDYIVPEVEAIATEVLAEFEQQGINVIPSAKAVALTMNREGIRNLAAKTLGLPTSNYIFASSWEEFSQAANQLGLPCIVKPIMSSSGKGQSLVRHADELAAAWQTAQQGGRTSNNRVMLESFIDFDYEITLLTVRHVDGTSFCQPIGHIQKDGDFQVAWQPQPMTTIALEKAQQVALAITNALGGFGLFGVELFIKADQVWFNEVSPRPHDTGMVTLISQNLSEFALHARAILGLPIPNITQLGCAAVKAIVVEGKSEQVSFSNLRAALSQADTELRLFGKPAVNGKRRMGVALAQGQDIAQAQAKAEQLCRQLKIQL